MTNPTRQSSQRPRAPRGPALIALMYLIVGALWILFSDRLVESLAPDVETLSRLQTYKGWFYVLATAVLLYAMVAAYVHRISRLQRDLRESATRYRTLFDSSPDALFVLDSQGRILDVNETAVARYGYSRDEFLGMCVMDLAAPDVRNLVPDRIRQALESGAKFESRHRRKDGSEFPVEIHAQGFALDGQPCILSSVRDITDRKQAEAEATQRRLFLESLFACVPDAIAVLDPQACVIEWGAGAERLFGYTRDEALGKHIDDLVARPDPAIHSQALHFTEQLLRGEPVGTREIVRFRKDGSPVTVIAAGAPIVMEGKVVGIVAVYTDITARKQMEEALRESERRYQILAEISPVGIFRTDAEGKTTYVNPRWCEISGSSAQDALGNGWVEVLHPDDRERILTGWQAAVQAQTVSPAEYRFQRPDGTVAWVIGQAVPETDDQGNVVGYVGTITDITERKQAEEEIRRLNADLERRVEERTAQLEAANRDLEAFSYSVSHDLRAPLRAIDGFSRILLEDYGPALDAEAQRLLGVVRNNTLRMAQLIDDLLTFSRTSRAELRPVAVDMAALVREVADELLAQEQGRTIDLRIGDLPEAHCDRAMMRQVFANLLSNAIKFTRPRPVAVIEVDGWVEKGENVYKVRDNGVGFDPQYADKLFVVFQRLHRMEEFGGTGVGLALVHRIITKHGGRVWAESQPDKGAAFYFALPAETGFAASPLPPGEG